MTGARGSVVGWRTMLQAWRSRVRFPMRSLYFIKLTSPFQPHYGPQVDSASKINEYQESSWGGKERPVREADKFTAICEPTVYKMWGPRSLTTL
jgi:hypothetical protein